MKKSNSSLSIRGNSNVGIKKINGIDTTNKSFVKKVEMLKTRTHQETIEDQYVKGLQDQIKYLQLQLKLLKQKQADKQGQFQQLEKFFGDGIPINQNILAIKNGFNNYQSDHQKKLEQIKNEKQQREDLIKELRERTDQMSEEIKFREKEIRKYDQVEADRFAELVGKQQGLKRQIQMEDQSLRTIKAIIRKLAEKMNTQQRNKQIEMVTNLKNQNHKYNKLIKLKQLLIEKQKEAEEVIKQYQLLVKQDEDNNYVIAIEEENVNSKKSIITMEKQFHVLDIKIKQMKLQLEGLLKNRYKEINAKVEMKNRLLDIKQILSKQNSLTVEDIQNWAKEQLIKYLKKTVQKNKKLSKITSYYADLLSKVEDNIQELVQKKPQLRNQITIFGNDVTQLLKSISKEQKRQCQLISSIVQSQTKSKRFEKIIPGIADKVMKEQQQIKNLQCECEGLEKQIKIKEKQLQLIAILKGLSLEEVEISKSTSVNIQDRLVSFMRNWQNLIKTT